MEFSKLLPVAAVAALGFMAASAMAGTGDEGAMYGRVEGGYAFAGKPEVFSDTNYKGLKGLNSKKLSGFSGGLALGYYFTDCVRTDLAIEYRKLSNLEKVVTSDDGKGGMKMESFNATVNAYYDFHTGTSFVPFVTAGVGFGHTKHQHKTYGTPVKGTYSASMYMNAESLAGMDIKNTSAPLKLEKTKNALLYQGGVGVGYRFNNSFGVDLTYRLGNRPGFSGKTSADSSYDATGLPKGTKVGVENSYVSDVSLGLRVVF